MNHIELDELVELAKKIFEDDELSENEALELEHVAECVQCETRLASCLDYYQMLEPEHLEEFWRMQKEESILYRFRFVVNRLHHYAAKCTIENLLQNYPAFSQAMQTNQRGTGTEECRLSADFSYIAFEPENRRLEIGLDRETFGEEPLTACLCAAGKVIEQQELVFDGIGLLTAEFQEIEEDSFELSIRSGKL